MLNIMNPPADWSTLKKLIWLRGTPITGGEELTVSGTPPLSLPNSLGKPLKAWSVDVLPYQEGSGDPAPDNVRPIHGTNQISFVTTGKNLFDPNWMSGQVYYSVSGNDITVNSNDSRAWSNVTAIQHEFPAGTYTISRSNTSGGVQMKFSIDNYTTTVSMGAGFTSVSFTKTEPFYMKVKVGVGTDVAYPLTTTIQLETGSTATDYVPYVAPSQTVLTLPQTVYTGTIGSDGGESRWGEVDLGTLNWTTSAYRFNTTMALPNAKQGNHADCMCEVYKPDVGSASRTADLAVSIANGGYVYIYDTTFTGDATAFKAAMNGVILIYALQTPTTFAVPAVTIPTPTGTATTWATAENGTVESMEVTYVGKA